jgi:dTDP-glucose 4,6-dehydratase
MGKPDRLISHIQDRPGHDRRYAVTSAKIETQLGWRPLIPLEKGLQQTIDWYVQNRSWVDGVRSRDYLNYYGKYYENRDSSLREISRQKGESTVRY